MHHFVTEMLENGALWVICHMSCGICEMDELFIILLFSDFKDENITKDCRPYWI